MATVRTQREIRQKAPLWLIGLLLANVVIMAIDARDSQGGQQMVRVWTQTVATPVQNVSSKAGGATSNFFRQIFNFHSIAAENEQLKQRVTEMESELHNARLQTAENERLKGLLGLVVTVSPWASQVMLVTDEKAGAGAVVGQLGESGALGSVRGRPDLGLIEMRYVSGLEKVTVGDFVVTTGQDGIYPAGLNVGEIVDVKNGTATQPHQILIRPGARLDRLEEVAVLLYEAPQRTAPAQTLPNVEKKKQ